jgi:hypothetical protein
VEILEACRGNDVERAANAIRDHLHSSVRIVVDGMGLGHSKELELRSFEISTYVSGA